jgi:hypothetical protein
MGQRYLSRLPVQGRVALEFAFSFFTFQRVFHMKDLLKHISPRYRIPRRSVTGRKTVGQSLVEVAIILPILLMLFSGMVEFGFMLNTYLSLLDATRQVARQFSNTNPFELVPDPIPAEPDRKKVVDNMAFYYTAQDALVDLLNPPGPENAGVRRFELDTTQDDIIISVIAVRVSDAEPDIVHSIARYPDPLTSGEMFPYYRAYDNQESAYADDATIEALMVENGALPIRTGILIIEIYYSYEGVLQLPWVEIFLDSVMLHADTVMPLGSAKPPRATPSPSP